MECPLSASLLLLCFCAAATATVRYPVYVYTPATRVPGYCTRCYCTGYFYSSTSTTRTHVLLPSTVYRTHTYFYSKHFPGVGRQGVYSHQTLISPRSHLVHRFNFFPSVPATMPEDAPLRHHIFVQQSWPLHPFSTWCLAQ